ncbi:MAG TPA: MASE1 domain-containing protein [Candidatus Paceibacterota bacterium]|nr:MASE1 domain-containing protein [Candidatus Paceibacterota bacterium]
MSALLDFRGMLQFMASPKYLWKAILIVFTYFTLGRLGLMFDAASGFASLVWPPTGISIALLFLMGRRYAPAIFVGALLTNLTAGANVFVAIGIGLGNMLEAVLAAGFLRSLKFNPKLCCVEDVLTLLLPVAIFSTLVSAIIGCLSLLMGGVVTINTFAETWVSWWIGDMIGALVFTPIIIVWHDFIKEGKKLEVRLEWLLPFLTVVAVNAMVFFGGPDSFLISHLVTRSYFVFIPLIWLAFRFNETGIITALFTTSIMAIIATASGSGPFAGVDLSASLLSLQIFLGVLTATILFLYASIMERFKNGKRGNH